MKKQGTFFLKFKWKFKNLKFKTYTVAVNVLSKACQWYVPITFRLIWSGNYLFLLVDNCFRNAPLAHGYFSNLISKTTFLNVAVLCGFCIVPPLSLSASTQLALLNNWSEVVNKAQYLIPCTNPSFLPPCFFLTLQTIRFQLLTVPFVF